MPLFKRCIAEFIGTFWLVLGGCGSAVIASAFFASGSLLGTEIPYPLGIGLTGVSLAFGLSLLTMAYAIGPISGCHINPAVSFGLWAGKRFPGSELLPYIVAQVLGAFVGALVVYLIASGQPNFAIVGSNPLATNGFGTHSPGGYGFLAALLTEIVLTFIFLLVILSSTETLRVPAGFAPLPIGLALTLIHLISIPVTNTSVNPARSTGPAIMVGLLGNPELVGQLWLFWIAPILGAVLAGYFYTAVLDVPSRHREAVVDRQVDTERSF